MVWIYIYNLIMFQYVPIYNGVHKFHKQYNVHERSIFQ